MNLENLVRENIKRLVPYSSARTEFSGAAQIYLDANENSFGSPLPENYNRYPDPQQTPIREKIALVKKAAADEIFIGHGSDEAIDSLFRIFCEPRLDSVVICRPTYGMYEVAAQINDVEVRRANLTADFRLDWQAIENAVDESTKLLFICSPNNPTGNAFARREILEAARKFNGIVVLDEAYVDFSGETSLLDEIKNHPNLVILQTFSKAWGLAGLRIGMAFADKKIISLFNRVKLPYNISQIAQDKILEALENQTQVEEVIAKIIAEREALIENLREFSFVTKIYPTDANFVLVKTIDAEKIYRFLLDEKIVIRNRNSVELCAGCLRITIGTPDENKKLLEALKKL